ncbi:MAG TPA: TetR/AcrR family transcriptional regulator [Rhizomicrobium sp.]|nr:TetR/AcrR family transcriptional regulator [Rhizomicrobium sp.]
MRYSESHKAETREKILKVASRALREKGPQNVAVAEVMEAAGLTHGGFYAHFKSKDALLVETLKHTFSNARLKALKAVEGLPPRHALAAYVDFYVSPRHRDFPERGCPISALNSDLPRQSKKFREVYDEGVKRLVLLIAGWLEEAGYDEPEKLSNSLLSAMVGAVSLSRSVADKGLSDELLESARAGIKARLGLTDVALSRTHLNG